MYRIEIPYANLFSRTENLKVENTSFFVNIEKHFRRNLLSLRDYSRTNRDIDSICSFVIGNLHDKQYITMVVFESNAQ